MADDGPSLTRRIELPAMVSQLHRDVAAGTIAAGSDAIAAAVGARAPWLGSGDVARLIVQVRSRLTGLGEVASLLDDDSVTDVFVDGPGPVVVERNGRLEPSGIVLDDDGVQVLVERLMSYGHRRVDRRHPCVDLRLPGGMRANIVVAPAAVGGPCISLRRFRTVITDLDDMASSSTVDLLRSAVEARSNIVISGATGSGKTTLLGLLISAVDPGQRVVTIEDVAEIKAVGPMIVRLEAQPGDGEGRPEVTVRALFRNALRMRPDRVVIGEIRGSEATDLIQALGTGHRGSMTTVHADNPAAALRRLELLIGSTASVGSDLVRSQIASVIDVMVHVERQADGSRNVVGLARLDCGVLVSALGEVGVW